jgi:hypothetical protein
MRRTLASTLIAQLPCGVRDEALGTQRVVKRPTELAVPVMKHQLARARASASMVPR